MIAALVARPDTRTVVLAVTLFLIAGPIQPTLAWLGHNSGVWFGALHGLVGVAILGLLGALSRPLVSAPGSR